MDSTTLDPCLRRDDKVVVSKLVILLFVWIFFPITLFAYTSPGKPTGFINDFAHILSQQEVQAISSQLQSVQQKTGVEFSVVTIPTLGDESVETYSTKLFAEWGIGNEKKDTGLLILVAPNDRQVRIEVGYGLEGAVTDIQSGNVIRSVMTPDFKEGKYGEGISDAVAALDAIISKSPEALQYSIDDSANNSATNNLSASGWKFNPLAIFFVFVIILNGLARILGKTKSWWLGGVIGAIIGAAVGLIFGFISAGLIAIIILTILGLIFDFIVSKRPPGSSGGTGFWPLFLGGGRGGSGGGGGFGGFGGGMSGGGGASGRW